MRKLFAVALVGVVLASPAPFEVGGANVAQVHDYIGKDGCDFFIRRNRPACVGSLGCFPVGTDLANKCLSTEMWQWQNFDTGAKFAPGVLPMASHRETHNGGVASKIVWTYVSDITQGEAVQNYNIEGAMTVEDVLNTPTNHISMISNMYVNQSQDWFKPGANNSGGCGQKETLGLPFGFNGSNTDPASYAPFIANLSKLHSNGVAITLTMGSWCTQFPVNASEEWSAGDFRDFVTYFQTVRQTFFGGFIDGIDWDWEGFCTLECLKGACHCDWNDEFCTKFSPEELAQGQVFPTPDGDRMCYIMPTKSTLQVMAGVTYYMKAAGFVVTSAPMSTAVYTDAKDTTPKQVMRNELIKYGDQPYPGGKQIDGDKVVNFLQMCDGILLQWYSGYDASLCLNTPESPMNCACNNVPDDDYPNVINVSNDDPLSGSLFFGEYGFSSLIFFPSTFPVRCQACGKNVILPNGTRGDWPCFPPGENWFVPCNETLPDCWANHTAGMVQYRKDHNNSIPFFWPTTQLGVNSKCPRAIDCPDFQYTGEPRYASQVKLLLKLANAGLDLNRVSIGYETMGVDVFHQLQSFKDPVNYFPTTNVTQHDLGHYWDSCTQNMTSSPKDDVAQGMRCGSSITHQHWGPKFNATDIIGLEAALRLAAPGKDLAGVGTFTLDGMMWTPTDTPVRYWFPALMELNKTYMIPCFGDACGGRTPVPAGNRCNPDQPGGCNVCAACCQTYIHDQGDCDACVTAKCVAPTAQNFCGLTFSDAQANCKTTQRCVSNDAECPNNQHCYTGIDCSGPPPPPPPTTKNWCGTSWTDANTNCNTCARCVSQDSECPAGQHCYTGIINCPSKF